jgi:hypothetical protein
LWRHFSCFLLSWRHELNTWGHLWASKIHVFMDWILFIEAMSQF